MYVLYKIIDSVEPKVKTDQITEFNVLTIKTILYHNTMQCHAIMQNDCIKYLIVEQQLSVGTVSRRVI